jgi:hypothetical protein
MVEPESISYVPHRANANAPGKAWNFLKPEVLNELEG